MNKNKNKNKYTKIKTKRTAPVICNNCSLVPVYAYHCAQLWYTIRHRTVQLILPIIVQMIIISQHNNQFQNKEKNVALSTRLMGP